jgi:hypothetical protein
MATSTLTPLAFASPRELTKAYLRLTADVAPNSNAILNGVWAPEVGYTNTIAQTTNQLIWTLIAGRHYSLEMWPYATGVGSGNYAFWEWRTTAGALIPATAMGGIAYGPAGREEMGACIRCDITPSVNVDVCVWTATTSGVTTLSGESSSRSTSAYCIELPSRTF